jgi:DNA-binding XRE family transcriptional regulator
MEASAQGSKMGMNIFEKLIDRLKLHFCGNAEVICRYRRPLEADGFWTFSMVFADEYLVSVAWNRHRGFHLTTGYDIPYGVAYDEVFGNDEAVFARISILVEARESTDFAEPVDLAELRKLLGIKQGDLALRLEMTKGGLSQLENDGDLLSMKIGTIKKLLGAMGADLVLTAQFSNGDKRVLTVV